MKAKVVKTRHAEIPEGTEVEIIGYAAKVSKRFTSPAATATEVDQDRIYSFNLDELLCENESKPETAALARIKTEPDTRPAITHKFDISGNKGYITCGLREDGQPFEIFITLNKTGGTLGGVTNCVARAFSMLLQLGMPLEQLVRKFEWHRFEPCGPTTHPQIKHTTSVIDYVARWLGYQFVAGYKESEQ